MAKKGKNTLTVNWDEEEGGKFLTHPGEYIVKLIGFEQDESENGNPLIQWTARVEEGREKGSTIRFSSILTPKTLWRLRALLTCVGVEIPDGGAQDLDLDAIIEDGEKFVIEVVEGNENPNGGYYMRVDDYMPYEDYKSETIDDGEEEPEEEVKPKKSKSAPQVEEVEDEEEDDIIEAMEDAIDELGLDLDLDDYDTLEEKQKAFEKAKKKASKSSKKPAVKDEEPEDDEDEVEYTEDDIKEMGTKQLRVIAEEIGLELDDDSSTKSKRRSVIAALKKAGKL